MNASKLGVLAALGLACLASSVLVTRKPSVRATLDAVLDRTYN